MKTCEGVKVQLHSFLISVVGGSEWCAARPIPLQRLGGLHSQSGRCAEEENSLASVFRVSSPVTPSTRSSQLTPLFTSGQSLEALRSRRGAGDKVAGTCSWSSQFNVWRYTSRHTHAHTRSLACCLIRRRENLPLHSILLLCNSLLESPLP